MTKIEQEIIERLTRVETKLEAFLEAKNHRIVKAGLQVAVVVALVKVADVLFRVLGL